MLKIKFTPHFRISILIIIVLYVFTNITLPVYALSPQQKQLYQSGVYHYNIDDGSSCDYGYSDGSTIQEVGDVKDTYKSGVTGDIILEMFMIHLLKRLSQINNKPESDYVTLEHVIGLLAFQKGEGGDTANSSVFNPMNGGMDPKTFLGIDGGGVWGGDGGDGRRAYPSFDVGIELYARQFSTGYQSRLNYILSKPKSTAEQFAHSLTYYKEYPGNAIWAAASKNDPAGYYQKELGYIKSVRKNYTAHAGLMMGTDKHELTEKMYRKDLIFYKNVSGNMDNGKDEESGVTPSESDGSITTSSSSACYCTDGTNGTIASGDIGKMLQAIAMHESRGDPKAGSPESGTASGKYQYIDSTWSGVSKAYPPAQKYVRAKDAPENIQDAVAYIEYAKKYKEFNGDIFKMIVSHYVPAANSNPALLDVVPSGNKETPREFANNIIDAMKTGIWTNLQNKSEKHNISDVKLLYSTAPDFNKYLKEAGVENSESTGVSSGGCDPTSSTNPTSGEFIFYSQNNPKWGRLSVTEIGLGSDIDNSGCGLTSYSMIAATLKKDKNITPKTFRQELIDRGLSIAGFVGLESAKAGKKIYGLDYEELAHSKSAIKSALDGGALIVSGGKYGPYRFESHIIVMRFIDNNGMVHVADPEDDELVDRTYALDDFISHGLYFVAVKG